MDGLRVKAAIVFGFFTLVSTGDVKNQYCSLSCQANHKNVTHTVCQRGPEKCGPAKSCGSDFKPIELDDDDRQYILDIHNYCRNKVALGLEKRNKQPSASNMNILRYNKELEFIAQCWSNSCNGSPLIHDKCRRTADFRYVGQNIGFVNTSNPNIDKVNIMKDLIVMWFDEVAIFDRNWINKTEDRGKSTKVGHYTQMVWADTTDVGCAMSYYSKPYGNRTWYHVILACDYGPSGNILGQPLYKIGFPLKNCPAEKQDIEASIYKGLCGKPEKVTDAKKFTPDVF